MKQRTSPKLRLMQGKSPPKWEFVICELMKLNTISINCSLFTVKIPVLLGIMFAFATTVPPERHADILLVKLLSNMTLLSKQGMYYGWNITGVSTVKQWCES